MRILPSTIRAVLEQDYGETYDVVILTIPEQVNPPSPETTIHLSTVSNLVVDGQSYLPKLRSIGQIKFSLGRAPDNADITIENVSRDFGFILLDSNRAIDGSKVTIKRAFRIADGTFTGYTLFNGYVRDVKVDQSLITLSVISDMSRRGTNIANHSVTQRCAATFKDKICVWQTGQGGNPNSCDYGKDTVNGCNSHNNGHRFYGVPSFTSLSNVVNDSGGGLGGGYYGGYNGSNPYIDGDNMAWCISPNTFVLCINKKNNVFWLRAQEVTNKETLIAIDKFGIIEPTNVLEVVRGNTDKLITLETKKGFSLECSSNHHVITNYGDVIGKPVNSLVKGDSVLVYKQDSTRAILDEVTSITSLDTKSEVITFKLQAPNHTYVSGATRKGGIVSHNLKASYNQYRMFELQ